MKRLVFLFFSIFIFIADMSAIEQPVAVTLDRYLTAVLDSNITLAAERLNIPVAEAELQAAKVFNDPTLSVEYANNDDHRMQMGQSVSVELGYTLSPGKRGARVDLARSEKALADALLTDYIRSLRLEAAMAYFDAVKQHRLAEIAADTWKHLSEIARGDSLRLAIGEIREVDAMQSRIEATIALGEMATANTEYENSLLVLNGFLSSNPLAGRMMEPGDDLSVMPRDYDPAALAATAVERRADLAAAMKNVEVARKALTVERRERNIDIDLALGYNYNTEVRNEIAPAPRFSGITVGVAIPLKFSNTNRGTIIAADNRVKQAEYQYREAMLEVQRQVIEAYNNYETAKSLLVHFDTDVIEQSAIIFNSYLKGYRTGDVSLVELMEIIRSYNEVRNMYVETRFNHAVALLKLQNVAAMND